MTPLAAIKGFIETLEEPEAGGNQKTRARFLGILNGEASRIQALIKDLMSLSRIEAEKYALAAVKVHMEKVIIGVLLRVFNQSRPLAGKTYFLNIVNPD